MFHFVFSHLVFGKHQHAFQAFVNPNEFMEFAKNFCEQSKQPAIWPALNLDDIDELRAYFTNKYNVCTEEKNLDQIRPLKRATLRFRYNGMSAEVMEISMAPNKNWLLQTSLGKLEIPQEGCEFYFYR